MADDQESTLPFVGAEPARPASPGVALTVLAHPDPERVGERLRVARPTAVSRVDGRFGCPSAAGPGRPLDTRWLSRTPLEFTPRADGAVAVRADPARIRLVADGQPVDGQRAFSADAVARSIGLVINGAVALLLHRTRGSESTGRFPALVGDGDAMCALRTRIALAGPSPLPVLVRGETGTGKELVARALHAASDRAGRPFVAVNLGAIPPELAASTLFGHEPGAFSGAGRGRPGAFRAAEGGTLFLDEVGEAPGAVQTALLRVLEVAEIQPVGRARPVPVDARVIAATDADLDAAVAAGGFRAALLERLGALELRTPPLRDRPEDVGRLLYHFLAAGPGAERLRSARQPEELWPPAAIVARLATLDWPRNVRQLRNIAHEMATFSTGHPFRPGPKLADLLAPAQPGPPPDAPEHPDPRRPRPKGPDPETLSTGDLRRLLAEHRWRISAVARALGLSQGGMYGLLRRHAIPIARDLDRYAFQRALSAAGGDLRLMAEQLEMSVRALTLRRRQLGLAPDD